MTPTIPTEHQEQVALFKWLAIQAKTNPLYDLAFSIPNGGKRNLRVAVKMKREGVRRGVPDIFLPVARNGAHGLFIELKRLKGGTLKPPQKNMIKRLLVQKYQVKVCRGWKEAAKAIVDYLDQPTTISDSLKKEYPLTAHNDNSTI